MSTVAVPRVIAVLDLPRKTADVISYAQAVANGIKGNPALPAPTPTLAVFEADIAALSAAEAVTLTRAKGAAEARNVKLEVVRTDLILLLAYVQSVASANTTLAAEIIESAGMSVRKHPEVAKSELAVRAGVVPGTARISARAVALRAAYEWQVSVDQKVWTTLPTTLSAKTELSGLTPATVYFFRFRGVTKAGEGGWSPAVSFLVP